MKKQFSLILLAISFLSSCSNKMTLPGDCNIQLVPEKQVVEHIDNIKVTYVIPKDISNEGDIDGLFLSSREWGESSKREKIISSFGDAKMQVERRVDNGAAGSGLVYSIDIENEVRGDNKVITLLPKKVRPYQDGLILPFPVPKFDLKTYLSSAIVYHTFEVISEYPQDSIRANFDRLLQVTRSGYELQTNDFSSTLKVKIYPYRKGSKVVIESRLFDMKIFDNVINVSKDIKELETRINNIIKD